MDRTHLAEYGGPATLSRGWAKSLLKRMDFCRRMCTTQVPPERVKELKLEFLHNIVDIVTLEEIPAELIFNWDQTGLNLVPTSNWTLEHKGTKRVAIKGFKDKRMITGVFCCSALGELLPFQLIYGGTTNRCHPTQKFPSDWSITYNKKHWSNEESMLLYISDVIVPYVDGVWDSMNVGKEQAALAIFDHFKGQLTQDIVKALEEENIHSVVVPACCTDQLQPLDLTVNSRKIFLQRRFREWFADEVASQFDDSDTSFDPVPVDLSTARMKSIGVKWLIELHQYLCNNPQHAVNGFIAAGISQSIEAGKPVICHSVGDATEVDIDESDENDDTEDDDESSGDSESSDNEFQSGG